MRPEVGSQEAHMRAIDIALIVIAVLMGVALWTNRTIAVSEAPKAAVYGHIPHVAVPASMKAFPAELIPLP
jgi:hypothetical protein